MLEESDFACKAVSVNFLFVSYELALRFVNEQVSSCKFLSQYLHHSPCARMYVHFKLVLITTQFVLILHHK